MIGGLELAIAEIKCQSQARLSVSICDNSGFKGDKLAQAGFDLR